ncbi:MAG: branched-chain amino acid transporter permease [Anaerosporomusa subterranea]|nr:branched-chain amino acid transporter permease [Anaerosporomusa subterranea]
MANKKAFWIITILAAVLAITIPLTASNYMLRVVNMTMITYICVLSMFVVFGMAGQISFAQAGFWGVGAYITAILTTKLGVSPLLALIASGAGAAIVAFIMGLALFRLQGHYFGFSTIGLVMILNGVFQNWKPVTGGADGIGNIPAFSIGSFELSSETSSYFLIFVVSVVISIVTQKLHRSALGRSFMAIRDNEIAAKCMGVNSYRNKIIAFTIAASYCGIAGSLFAFLASYISATTFNFAQSSLYLVMLMLGGYNYLAGPMIGTALLMLLPEWFRPLQEYIMLIYGVGVMLLMVVMPEGLIGGGKKLYAIMQSKRGWATTQAKNDIR